MHIEHEQRVCFDPTRHSATDLQAQESLRKTMLTDYFRFNRVIREAVDTGAPLPFAKNPLDLLYIDLPEHFTWHGKSKE